MNLRRFCFYATLKFFENPDKKVSKSRPFYSLLKNGLDWNLSASYFAGSCSTLHAVLPLFRCNFVMYYLT